MQNDRLRYACSSELKVVYLGRSRADIRYLRSKQAMVLQHGAASTPAWQNAVPMRSYRVPSSLLALKGASRFSHRLTLTDAGQLRTPLHPPLDLRI
jgi:hypothetical protein